MLESLFPRVADNTYRGNRLALVLFGLLTALKLLIGMRSMLDPVAVAQGADGIPIDSFSPDAAREVLSTFSLLGMHFVMVAVLSLIVLWRYRTLVPMMFLLQLAFRGVSWLLKNANPGAITNPNAPGDIVSEVILGLTVAGLVLSLMPGRQAGKR